MRYRQSGWISISPSIQGNLVVGRDTSRFQIVTFFDARPLKKFCAVARLRAVSVGTGRLSRGSVKESL